MKPTPHRSALRGPVLAVLTAWQLSSLSMENEKSKSRVKVAEKAAAKAAQREKELSEKYMACFLKCEDVV